MAQTVPMLVAIDNCRCVIGCGWGVGLGWGWGWGVLPQRQGGAWAGAPREVEVRGGRWEVEVMVEVEAVA